MEVMDRIVTRLAKADAELKQRLSDELDAFNASATSEVDPADELTVQVLKLAS